MHSSNDDLDASVYTIIALYFGTRCWQMKAALLRTWLLLSYYTWRLFWVLSACQSGRPLISVHLRLILAGEVDVTLLRPVVWLPLLEATTTADTHRSAVCLCLPWSVHSLSVPIVVCVCLHSWNRSHSIECFRETIALMLPLLRSLLTWLIGFCIGMQSHWRP